MKNFFNRRDEIEEAVEDDLDIINLDETAEWSKLDVAEEMARQKYGSADYNALDEEMRKTFVKVISEDLHPLLPQIQASTLLIWGDQDTATPLWMGRTMEKEIPDAGLVIFEGATHYAYLEQWQRFVAIAENFLLKE